MKIWIITELFYPEENATGFILTHIANHLTKKFDVNVICGPAQYGTIIDCDRSGVNRAVELSQDVKVHRIDIGAYNKDSLFSRMRHQIRLSLGFRKELKRQLLPGDKVLMVTNPATLLLFLPKFVRKKGNKLSIIVHDVFPENIIPAGIVKSSKSLLYRFLKRLFDKAYQRADKLFAIGRDMQEVLIRKLGANPNKTEVVVVENWAENKLIGPCKSLDLESRHDQEILTIQFAGNLGRVQGLGKFLKLLKESGNKNLLMDIWGDGAVKKDLIQYHKESPELKIDFHGKFTRSQQSFVLSNADLSLITLAEGMYGLGVPSKSYNIMAAGKPILFIGDLKSEIARVIADNKIGYSFDTSDTEGIISFLKGLSVDSLKEFESMGRRARLLADTVYSQETILSKYISLF